MVDADCNATIHDVVTPGNKSKHVTSNSCELVLPGSLTLGASMYGPGESRYSIDPIEC